MRSQLVFTEELADSYQTLASGQQTPGQACALEAHTFFLEILMFSFQIILHLCVCVAFECETVPGTHGNLWEFFSPSTMRVMGGQTRIIGLSGKHLFQGLACLVFVRLGAHRDAFYVCIYRFGGNYGYYLVKYFFSVPERLSDHVSRATHFFSLYFLPVFAGTAHC